MTADELKRLVKTYRYTDDMYVVVDSLPEPYLSDLLQFLRGSAVPLGDGKNRYAFTRDFDRWLAASSLIAH